MESSALADRSLAFALELQGVLDAVLPGQHSIVSEQMDDGQRFVVRPDGVDDSRRIALTIKDQHVIDLGVAYFLTLDHAQAYLKAVRSDLKIYLATDRRPLVRLEYRSDMISDPVSHWHIHADRARFSVVFETAAAARKRGFTKQRDLSAMHIPVGGERFRPCLEDLLEFLIRELGVDRLPGWRRALRDGRERWRLRQLSSAVRDRPHQAAQTLKELNWNVVPPGVAQLEDHEFKQRW